MSDFSDAKRIVADILINSSVPRRPRRLTIMFYEISLLMIGKSKKKSSCAQKANHNMVIKVTEHQSLDIIIVRGKLGGTPQNFYTFDTRKFSKIFEICIFDTSNFWRKIPRNLLK